MNWNHTWAKSTLSHFVPLVNALKEAAPSRAPEGVPRNAIQFTTADPFVPRPDSSTQMRKLFCVTSVVQTTAESWTLSVSFSWLMDASTRMLLELENAWGYCTVLQWSKLGDTTVKLTFPCCRRLCPESGNCWQVGNGTISEVEWRFTSGRSQAIFYKLAALCVFKLLTYLNKTKLLVKIVKSRKLLRKSKKKHSVVSQGINEYA